ncbi:MAG: proline--tRNA ligase [Bacilli bacterium]
MADKKVTAVASKSENLTQWYTDVCTKAELMDYASTKGFIIYRPDGYALWEEVQKYLDKRFKEVGVRNVYLPTIIPMSLLNKEKEHIQGFAPECFEVSAAGGKPLADHLVIRPTSETLFCDYFKDIVHSYNDLPIENNQWCSVLRAEKTTRPFLRGAEFLWQECHALHASENEARNFALSMLKIYYDLGREMLAIPFVAGCKPESEKFAGAVSTYTIEALMPDGQALQCGTTHYLGTGFCEKFGIKYQDKNNKIAYPHYSSHGASTRLLGALIMVHGDDNGLVLPPKIAPTQVVIIPIRGQDNPEVNKVSQEIYDILNKDGIRVYLDSTNKTPGWKFSQYEMKGVPLRIEIGPKDLANGVVTMTRRFDGFKKSLPISEISATVALELQEAQDGMYKKAYDYLKSHIVTCHTEEEIADTLLNHKGFVRMMAEDTVEEEKYMKEKYNATPRVMPFDEAPFDDKDPLTGNKADKVVYFDRAY